MNGSKSEELGVYGTPDLAGKAYDTRAVELKMSAVNAEMHGWNAGLAPLGKRTATLGTSSYSSSSSSSGKPSRVRTRATGHLTLTPTLALPLALALALALPRPFLPLRPTPLHIFY